MKKLSQEKRNHLTIAVLLTAAALAGIWFGLVSSQRRSIQILSARRASLERKLDQVTRTMKSAQQVEEDLADTGKTLDNIEDGMPSGDLYSWAINTIRQFKTAYKVEIPQFSQIDGPKQMSLFPMFPYKQATLTIGGSAYFDDFGKFVADFENEFPYMQLLNLSLQPLASANPGDEEKLSFKMDIVMLVKPGNP
jgi:Tfp pilus assembly protein PilO